MEEKAMRKGEMLNSFVQENQSISAIFFILEVLPKTEGKFNGRRCLILGSISFDIPAKPFTG